MSNESDAQRLAAALEQLEIERLRRADERTKLMKARAEGGKPTSTVRRRKPNKVATTTNPDL